MSPIWCGHIRQRSLTFAAAANCVAAAGGQPVFCDIVGPHDLNLDPADV